MTDQAPPAPLSRDAALEALAWHIAMGADEAIAADPIDRFAESAERFARPTARTPDIQSQPSHSSAPAHTTDRPGPRPIAPKPPQSVEGAGAAAATAAAEGATSLTDLKERLAAFDGGHLQRAAKNLVFADGALDAEIMFVGEAPGADEDRTGVPFVGRAGQLLDKMLFAAGLDRQQNAYITNVVPWRPLGNKTPDGQTIAMCLPFLKKHIQLKAPKVVVCLGASPARALFDTETGISRLRGKWQKLEFYGHLCHVLATYHPAYLLRQPRFKGDAWRDLLAATHKLSEEDSAGPVA